MKKVGLMFLMLVIGVTIGVRISGRLSPVEGQAKPGTGFAAVPGAVGGAGSDRPLRSGEELAEGRQHAAGQ